MNRVLASVLLLGLFVAGACLVFWLNRHYRAKGDTLEPKAACAMAALSFIVVGAGMVAETLPSSGQIVGRDGKVLPPNSFTIAATAVFFCTALLAAIGLLFGAAFQLVSSWLNPSSNALRRSAARFAIYGVGAFLVALGHLTLMRMGPGLLK